MESTIASALQFKHQPVALLFSNEKPEGARQFAAGKWGCVMFLLAAAVKGETAAVDRQTFGCPGGGVGLGFGNQYVNFAGGEACFRYFLSTGNAQWETGRQVGEQVRPYLRPESYTNFMEGERYLQSPELVDRFVAGLPMMEVPSDYVLLKPLAAVDVAQEKPEVVIFLVDMDRLAALTILANYRRGDNENVVMPWAAGCQTLGIYPLHEARQARPRAVLGLTDISARVYLKKLLHDDVMSFAVPFALFQEMEENVAGSFLAGHTWQELLRLAER